MDKRFLKIYNLYKNNLLRLAYSYTRDKQIAEDITQNVFIKFYNSKKVFINDNHIKNWLIRVTINECKDYNSSFWEKNVYFLSGQEQIGNKNNDLKIKNVVLGLPTKYSVIIYLYYYEGYKIKEIAKILKMNESTIKTNLSRARQKLKEILKEEWDNEE